MARMDCYPSGLGMPIPNVAGPRNSVPPEVGVGRITAFAPSSAQMGRGRERIRGGLASLAPVGDGSCGLGLLFLCLHSFAREERRWAKE